MITGNETVYPRVLSDQTQTTYSLTIRELALKDFMCAIIIATGKNMKIPQAIVNAANDLTNAYIEQLNK